MKKRERIICYDVRESKRLRRVANTLLDYGTRLQNSVFYCCLNETDFNALQTQLALIIHPEDKIDVFCFCRKCRKNIDYLGKAEQQDLENYLMI